MVQSADIIKGRVRVHQVQGAVVGQDLRLRSMDPVSIVAGEFTVIDGFSHDEPLGLGFGQTQDCVHQPWYVRVADLHGSSQPSHDPFHMFLDLFTARRPKVPGHRCTGQFIGHGPRNTGEDHGLVRDGVGRNLLEDPHRDRVLQDGSGVEEHRHHGPVQVADERDGKLGLVGVHLRLWLARRP